MFAPAKPSHATAALLLSDGMLFWGQGVGAPGMTGGEVCFNTSMTGYQEVMTDPSYAGQMITFTFPHIGNVGANPQDEEAAQVFAKGLILKADISNPANYRSEQHFNDWLIERGLTGICNVDTRALTHHLRNAGSQNGLIAYHEDGVFDLEALQAQLAIVPDMNGRDLAKEVTCEKPYTSGPDDAAHHVVVVDYGVKRNILNCLMAQGMRLTVVPCDTSAVEILNLNPDGIFLSNGPGDPAATGRYAVPVIKELLETGLPLFGICLGHQLLARSLGGATRKLPFGHRGANHPVRNLETGQVEITSQNHGFCVMPETLPEGIEVTHVSLFDGTNEGLRVNGQPVFSVQHHPEASPGPQDSQYLFAQFTELITARVKRAA